MERSERAVIVVPRSASSGCHRVCSGRRVVRLATILTILPACATPGATTLSPCLVAPAATDQGSTYFPPGCFAGDYEGRDEHLQRWFGKHLASMKEPSLSCSRGAPAETYRFLWLRTFHAPWAIRIEQTATGAQLFAVETGGRGGYEAGYPTRTISRDIGSTGWNALVSCVQGADFWHMPLKDNRYGFDGAEWIVEGVKGGAYRVITRWSPGSGPFYDLGWCFLGLAGLEDVTPVY